MLQKQKIILKHIDGMTNRAIARGFSISYATVKRLVKEIEDRHKEAFIRQEYEYGDVCEFDWGEVALNNWRRRF